MAFSVQKPVSAILKEAKNTEESEDEPKKKSREDWRKQKELEEARKAGTAPAAVDEEGRDINPHIPQYISSAPWYIGAEGPTLKHQRPHAEKQKEVSKIDEWYNRGTSGKAAIRFRKGACENCGAMTHKKKDCLERPRKVGAKFTSADIAPDEMFQPTLKLDYAGKRDRWNGYNPDEHTTIVEEFRKIEEAKRQLKAQKLKSGQTDGKNGSDDDEDSEGDEDKYVDNVDMPGTKVDSKQRITVRNLRIREDTAKYLRNLDPNSAYYDPKARAMRENPYEDTGKNPDEVDYAGEGFVRFTGDTKEHASAQLFAWEAYERGVDVNPMSEPTKLEILKKEYEKRKDSYKTSVQESLLDKYGGAEHLDAPPSELLLAQTENYVEYSRHGKIVKGQEKSIVKSHYEEDVYVNNHTHVWGSYWKDGKWGYRCCHSFIKNSYCTGETGQTVEASTALPIMPAVEIPSENIMEDEVEPQTLVEIHQENLKKKMKKKEKKKKEKEKRRRKKDKKKHKTKEAEESDSSESSESESDEEINPEKLKKALEKEGQNQKRAEYLLSLDERKRPYNSMYEAKEPTKEEMEAYEMKRRREEDPMLYFK